MFQNIYEISGGTITMDNLYILNRLRFNYNTSATFKMYLKDVDLSVTNRAGDLYSFLDNVKLNEVKMLLSGNGGGVGSINEADGFVLFTNDYVITINYGGSSKPVLVIGGTTTVALNRIGIVGVCDCNHLLFKPSTLSFKIISNLFIDFYVKNDTITSFNFSGGTTDFRLSNSEVLIRGIKIDGSLNNNLSYSYGLNSGSLSVFTNLITGRVSSFTDTFDNSNKLRYVVNNSLNSDLFNKDYMVNVIGFVLDQVGVE